jgi:multisubunit Na+/H+ antiporter MnhC subunit
MMLSVVSQAILPLAIMVSVYIFLRGHNLPGGGFIAGLITAVAIDSAVHRPGIRWLKARLSINYPIPDRKWFADRCLRPALGSFLWHQPFLKSWHGHFHIPWLGDIELASAMAFDLGCIFDRCGCLHDDSIQLGRLNNRTAHVERIARHGACFRSLCRRDDQLRGLSMPARNHVYVVIGLTLLSYAVNLFLFASGRLHLNAAPILGVSQRIGDPLPQALVLTAIVIGFGMTAFLVVLAMRTCADWGNDHVDGNPRPWRMSFNRRTAAMNHLPILPILLPSLAGTLMLLPPLSTRLKCSAGSPGGF